MKKRTRQLVTAVLTLLLVLGLSVTAWAAPSISTMAQSTSLEAGQSDTLYIAINRDGQNDADIAVHWESNNGHISISNKQLTSCTITAVSAGTAILTATLTSADGQTTHDTKTCEVTVTAAPVAVSGVSLDITEETLVPTDTLELKATIKPDNATDKTLSWTSSKESVATVDDNGKVTAVAAGSATITVTTQDGSKKATCAITVVDELVSVANIYFGDVQFGYSRPSAKAIEIKNSSTEKVTVTAVSLQNATAFELKSSNNNKTAEIAAGKTNSDWTVQPMSGLYANTNEYTDTVIISYTIENDLTNYSISKNLSFKVDTPASLTPGGNSSVNSGISGGTTGANAQFAGFITGFEDNTFRPQDTITLEQLISILYRLKAQPNQPTGSPNNPTFKDVAGNRWSFAAIEWANFRNIIHGDANGYIHPDKKLTRGEVANILTKTEAWSSLAQINFPDLSGHKYQSDCLKAVQAKVFAGYPDGTFQPDKEITRAEAVTALVRYILKGEPSDAILAGKSISFSDVSSSFWGYKYINLAVNGNGK